MICFECIFFFVGRKQYQRIYNNSYTIVQLIELKFLDCYPWFALSVYIYDFYTRLDQEI